MSKFQAITKREKSLAENVITVAVVSALMASFIYYFFRQDQQITQTGFDNIANNFSARVTAIRAQWFMDNQPDLVITKDNNLNQVNIRVNRYGWVDYEGRQRCKKVWFAVMDSELFYMKQPIIVLLIENKSKLIEKSCQYALPSGEFFNYQMRTGKIGKVKVRQYQ